MDPVVILKNIATIASTIETTVTKVEINKVQCQHLAFRVSLITSAISSFQTTSLKTPNVDKTFSGLVECLNWCLDFIREFDRAPGVSKIFNIRKHEEKFSELNILLSTYALDLDFTVSIPNLQDSFNINIDRSIRNSNLKRVQELLQKGFESMIFLLQGKFDIITREIDAIINTNKISDANSLTAEQERMEVQIRDIEIQINNILNLMAQFSTSVSGWWKNSGKVAKKFIKEKLSHLRKYIVPQHISSMLKLEKWIREQKNHPNKVLDLKDDIKEIIDYIRCRANLIVKSTINVADSPETEFRLLSTKRVRETRRKVSDVVARKRCSTSSMDAKPTDPEDQFKLGVKYDNGEGVEKDDTKATALRCYQKAADQGYLTTQSNLGLSYDEE